MLKKGAAFYHRLRAWVKRQARFIFICICGLLATFGIQMLALSPADSNVDLPDTDLTRIVLNDSISNPPNSGTDGGTLYQNGRFAEAAAAWKKALELPLEPLDKALTWNYLSLAYQQLGNWREAEEAINQSLEILASLPDDAKKNQVLARSLSTQGRLEMSQGKLSEGLENLKHATEIYKGIGDREGVIGSQLNQAQILLASGLYRQSLKVLAAVEENIDKESINPLVKAAQLRTLGNALRAVGDLDRSKTALEQSLNIDRQSPAAKIATLVSLANTEQAIGDRLRAAKQIGPALTPFGCSIKAEGQVNSSTPEAYKEAEQNYNQAEAELNLVDNLDLKFKFKLSEYNFYVMLANLDYKPESAEKAQILDRDIAADINRLSPGDIDPKILINFAHTRTCLDQDNLQNTGALSDIEQLLQKAIERAESLGDWRTKTYALGQLGGVYEMARSLDMAKQLTGEAAQIANNIQAPDILYQWQWQLARLYKAEGKKQEAIAAYATAISDIESVRKNLNAINLDFRTTNDSEDGLKLEIQPLLSSINPADSPFEPPRLDTDIPFDFRSKIDPIYREYIELILPSEAGTEPQEDIVQARDLILQLQNAELETILLCDFAQTGEGKLVPVHEFIDQRDLKAAVIYPIILGTQGNYAIGVILKMPGKDQPLYFSKTSVSENPVELLNSLREKAEDQSDRRFQVKNDAKKFYQWLVAPIEAELTKQSIDTLVFVLDSPLRNLPLATLYDREREQYIIEKYAVVLNTSGIPKNAQPWGEVRLNPLVAGLNDPKDASFKALKQAEAEAKEVAATLNTSALIATKSKEIIAEDFTRDNFQREVVDAASPYNLIHMATHGKFSSTPKETFLMTAPPAGATGGQNRVTLNELDNLLRKRDEIGFDTIELLILSACQTAEGDNRAALGLAGVAIRAGARSTIASLWQVDDASTRAFMAQLSKKLARNEATKAEALRQVQEYFLTESDYKHPAQWAGFVLVGNWL
ncbi:MAG TPA: CHAT domain-containing protein [Oscillatoriaceae cyanobacterium M33_DOE_052]|uniref:CHAT domain-containing protein n=1 Tax=Planktothricoides sp. SpSt-374 TaxID=2282167 RepID=A0A7C3VSZ6_9CYAN|nr:CHAT domain-containing protein [Oscillatoriaceae cyanobacterium M33_DOE_052]